MITTINECLLNEQDYAFLSQSIIVNSFDIRLYEASNGLSMSLFFSVLLGIILVLLVICAVAIRKSFKKGSNVLLVVVAVSAAAIGAMVYSNYANIKSLQKEIKEETSIIESLEQPDPELFAACIESTAILKKLPNSNGVSNYKRVIGTANNY